MNNGLIAQKITELSDREREILKTIVQLYSDTGEPVGSQTISKTLGDLSSATVRNIFATIEELGFIRKSHCSSGRIPTDMGFRYFVDNILKVRKLSQIEKKQLDDRLTTATSNPATLIDEIPEMLSDVSKYTGIILCKESALDALKHIDFVKIDARQVLVILVDRIGRVTNRIIEITDLISQNELDTLRNFINEHLTEKSLFEIRRHFLQELSNLQSKYDAILEKIISLAGGSVRAKTSGETNVFDYLSIGDVHEIKVLLEKFRQTQFYLDLFGKVNNTSDMRIYIGAETDVFNTAGCGAILTRYEIDEGRIAGVIGVIGPRHMNYGKVIPIIDYTKNLLISLCSSK